MVQGMASSDEKKAKKHVVIYAPPAMSSHLVSMVELGKLLAAHGLEVTVVVGGRTDDGKTAGDAAAGSFAEGAAAAAHPELSFHSLPPVARPPDVPAHDYVVQAFELARASNSNLREFLRAASPFPAALVLDFFCGSALDVGADLGIPTYFFFTSSVAGLAELLYHPLIHEQTPLSLRDLGGGHLHAPGIPPIPVGDLPAAYLDRDGPGNRLFLSLSEQMCNSQGLIVNSFRSLEPRATEAIVSGLCTPPGRRTPPLHCIGPVVKLEEAAGASRHECLAWLDAQPEASVVFLCFGSLGRFSAEQTRQVARGLEASGQRFLWVVRSPPGEDGGPGREPPADPDLDALLPAGFQERTKDRGFVVRSWAPQVDVLRHRAAGAFVTHCGWNSVLEAVLMGGVPMLAWPMYAEQRMNKVFLVEEMRLAVALEGYDREMVRDEEVATKVRWLMESDGGRELRERTWAAMRRAGEALGDGGESRTSLLELVRQWKS
ncbi:Anthocyanidin 5,3-O-glucosyltransferase [Dichanthelium oligosanthes]|uniref:Glycosyltransferase n=1 Tax=Dichanthelium oligosanthes TaxID=888268 RepID=A0A1E5VRC3_9POAL|nr:Anthocyanidin 5,3-O-glucosyltransferase [Dichanthelium oligosanthes]